MRALRDAAEKLAQRNAVIVGVSVDKVATQKDFCTRQKLPFRLIADERGEVAQQFGVLNRVLRLARRVTFLIDPDGIVRAVITKVDLRRHGEQVLELLKALQKSG